MKKIFMVLSLFAFTFTFTSSISTVGATTVTTVGATTVTTVNTKHEKRYTNITANYGDYILRQYFYYETEEWVVDGTVRTFEGSCPTGWSYVPDPGGGVSPFSVEEPGEIISFGVDELVNDFNNVYVLSTYIQCEKQDSGYYTTQSSETWEDASSTSRLYWSNVTTNEKHDSFYYSNLISPITHVTLIQGEVLLVKDATNVFVHGIDRYNHYERNQYNINFPTTFSEFEEDFETQYNCETQETFKNYFHRLALYNDDTSNHGNVKYLCDVPSEYQSMFPNGKTEVIYSSSGYKELNDLVAGTFNFNVDTTNHYYYDVYPYLVWGNSFTDTSDLLERFYWDQNSARILTGDYYKYRGSTLFNKSITLFALYPSQTSFDESQWYIDNMYDIN